MGKINPPTIDVYVTGADCNNESRYNLLGRHLFCYLSGWVSGDSYSHIVQRGCVCFFFSFAFFFQINTRTRCRN